MNPLSSKIRRFSTLARAVVAFGLAAGAFPAASRAVTITNLSETANSLSYDFSGSGFVDMVYGPILGLTYWSIQSEGHGQNAVFGYGFSIELKHNPDGSTVSLDGNGVAWGSTLTDTAIIPHGSGVDSYSLSLTVQNDGFGQWGAFSGSLSAQHASVPDGGSTVLLSCLAVLLLAGSQLRLARPGC